MTLSGGCPKLEQLTAGFTCRGHDGILAGYFHNMTDDLFSGHGMIIFINYFFVIGKSAFSDHKCHIFSCFQHFPELLLEDMDIRTFVVGKDTTEEELADTMKQFREVL